MGIKIMIKKPNEKVEIKVIKDNLETLQSIVEGYIEYIPIEKLLEEKISIICNEEGKINNLDINIAFAHNQEIVDYVSGTMIFVATKETSEGVENDSLNDNQIKYINTILNQHKAITFSGEIVPIINI